MIAHENVLHRMSGLKGEPARMPYGVWPHDTFYTSLKQLYFGGEVVEMLHAPAAHTDGDVMVWFRKSDVVATGDVFSTVTYPHDRPASAAAASRACWTRSTASSTSPCPSSTTRAARWSCPGHGRI